MSDLDKYLPRLQNRTIAFIPSVRADGCTNWPDAEPAIRETLDEWTDCQGYKPTSKFTIKQWKSGARDFVSVHGESPKLLRKAWEFYLDIDWERRQTIVVLNPRSLIGFATKVLENEKEKKCRDPDTRENRQRYLKWAE